MNCMLWYLTRGGGEDSFGGFPPEAPDAHLAFFSRGFFVLRGEDLLHLGAEVAAEFGGEEAEEKAETVGGAALGCRHHLPPAVGAKDPTS